jgi:hypothetical protein
VTLINFGKTSDSWWGGFREHHAGAAEAWNEAALKTLRLLDAPRLKRIMPAQARPRATAKSGSSAQSTSGTNPAGRPESAVKLDGRLAVQ